MFNFAALSAITAASIRPSVLRPGFTVRDIRDCDWAALKRLAINGLVIDKDNCLTKPHEDDLIQDLEGSWKACLDAFGPENVLVVSNSAGLTSADPGLVQAESLSNRLGVPVLVHRTPKPAASVVRQIEGYFGGFPLQPKLASIVIPRRSTQPSRLHSTPRLLIIGDRISTDMILATRLRNRLGSSPGEVFGVLTERIWATESFGTRLMRWAEIKVSRMADQTGSKLGEARRKELGKCFRLSPSPTEFPVARDSVKLSSGPVSYKPTVLVAYLRNHTLKFLKVVRTRIGIMINMACAKLVNLLIQKVQKQAKRIAHFYDGSYGLGFQLPKYLEQLRMWKGKRI